jgi:hypothetical protein
VVGLELRNVVANYPFERAQDLRGFQPNSGHRDYSRLSCAAGEMQLAVPFSDVTEFQMAAAVGRETIVRAPIAGSIRALPSLCFDEAETVRE